MNAANPDPLRRYLLGAADDHVREEIEQQLFSDDQVFWERLGIAEDELIADYIAGALDGEERAWFESRFLKTDERRANLEFALALRTYANQRGASRTGVWNWLLSPAAVPRWALAAAASFLLVLAPALIWQFGPAGRGPAAVAVSLAPGLLRDAGGEVARVQPAPGCQVLHLDLTTGSEAYSAYGATIYDVNGVPLWSQHRLAGAALDGAVSIRLTVPCELLPEGDYWVRLLGVNPGQEPVSLDRYDFRVLR